MNYQRILVVTEIGVDTQATFAAIRRFAPSATQVMVIVQQPARQFAWLAPAAPPDLNDAARRALDELRDGAEQTAPTVDVALVPELTADALTDAVATSAIDLVVVAALPLRSLSVVVELRKRSSVPVLCVRSAPASAD
ncbi:MAG: universal stress protein, partial [Bryobacteraceae bacterium]